MNKTERRLHVLPAGTRTTKSSLRPSVRKSARVREGIDRTQSAKIFIFDSCLLARTLASFPLMSGPVSVKLAARLLLGEDVKVLLYSRSDIKAIFVDGATETSFTGKTWEDCLWKIRDHAFAICANGAMNFVLALPHEKSGELTHPAKGTDSQNKR